MEKEREFEERKNANYISQRIVVTRRLTLRQQQVCCKFLEVPGEFAKIYTKIQCTLIFYKLFFWHLSDFRILFDIFHLLIPTMDSPREARECSFLLFYYTYVSTRKLTKLNFYHKAKKTIINCKFFPTNVKLLKNVKVSKNKLRFQSWLIFRYSREY